MLLEITVTFLRDKDGKLVGFSLIPEPHTESEEFCFRFPRMYKKGNSIVVEGGKITFQSDRDKFSIDSASDAKDLDELLRSGQEFVFEGEGLLVPGFSLKFLGRNKVTEHEHPVKKHYT